MMKISAFFTAVSVLLLGGHLFGEAINMVPNPGFEEGKGTPDKWTPYPHADFGKTMFWDNGGREGSRALGILSPSNNCSFNSRITGVGQGVKYKLGCWANVNAGKDNSERPYLKVIMRDADGEWIKYTENGEVRLATKYLFFESQPGWRQYEMTLTSEARTEIFDLLFSAPANFQGDVRIDDLEMVEIEETGNPDNWMTTVDTGVRTPHVPWARPYAGRKLNAFVLINNQGKRELAELWQRLEMDFTAVVAASPSMIGLPAAMAKWNGSSAVSKMNELQEKLKAKFDCYLIGNVSWSLLPVEMRYLIFQRASEGAGLVFVIEQDEPAEELLMLKNHPAPEGMKIILGSVPADIMRMGYLDGGQLVNPGNKTLAELVSACHINKGRAVFLDYPYPEYGRMKGLTSSLYQGVALSPWLPYGPENIHHYEYYQQILIMAILWAAGNEPPCDMEIPGTGLGPADDITAVIRSAPENPQLRLEHRILSSRGIVVKSGVSPLTEHIAAQKDDDPTANLIQSPKSENVNTKYCKADIEGKLPSGSYTLELRLVDDKGKVFSFKTAALNVRGKNAIAQINVDRSEVNRGILSGNIILDEITQDPVRLTLADIYGRIVVDTNISGQDLSIPFSVKIPDRRVGRLHTLKAELAHDKITEAMNSTAISIPLENRDDIQYYLWSLANNGDIQYHFMNSYSKEHFGFNLYECDAYGKINRSLARKVKVEDVLGDGTMLGLKDDQTTTPYLIPVLYSGKSLTRQPCLNDPAYREFFKRILKAGVSYYYSNGAAPPFYTLGDEFLLAYPGGPDVCFSGYCQEDFRKWLKSKYDGLDSLNKTWNTAFKSWEEVGPVSMEDAKKQDQPARWLDHRLHMDDVIADLLLMAGQTTREQDPNAKIGFEGMFRSYSECGYDMEKITGLCDLMVSYEYPYRWEMLASFARPGTYYGVFSNTYNSPEKTRYQVWKAVCHGLNSIWWWRISGESGFLGYDLGVGANPIKYDGVVQQAADVKEARGGVSRLLDHSRRINQPIGILYSQNSLHMTKYNSDAAALSETWTAFQFIFEDLGYGYKYIRSSDLSDGKITPENTKVIVLPYAVCLPDKVVDALKNYVAAGGILLADIEPAIYDQYGRFSTGSPLNQLFGIERSGPLKLEKHQSELGDIVLDSSVALRPGAKALGNADQIPYGICNSYEKGMAVLLNFSAVEYGANITANDFTLNQHKAEFRLNHKVRELIGKALAPGNMAAPVGINQKDGNQLGIEQFEYLCGEGRIIALVRKIQGKEYLDQADEIEVFIREKSHVYDVRTKKYEGLTDVVKISLPPGYCKILACLPYQSKFSEFDAVQIEGPAIRISGKMGSGTGDGIRHVLRFEIYDSDGRNLPWYSQNLTLDKADFSIEIPLGLNENGQGWRIQAHDIVSGDSREIRL